MPYIQDYKRALYDDVNALYPSVPGDLNYLITSLALNYIAEQGENYNAYNDVIGALECAKMELYRRQIAPYEDKKIKENGDVF